MTLPGPGLFFIILGVSELGLSLFKRAKGGAKSADRGSLGVLWTVIGLSIFLAIFLTYRLPQFEVPCPATLRLMAIVLFVLGLALRWWSIIHLGRFFTVDVAIAADHRIVDDGPYRLLRHPSYTGALLAFVGLALMLGNWLSAAVLVVPTTIAFLWRIAIEERALSDAFGADHVAYKARTKRLVPFIY